MDAERFFYHSFPRGAAGKHQDHTLALATLDSILERGLLLTPENLRFRESLTGGVQGPECAIGQKRICFTELRPSELVDHAKSFGPFSFEWDIETLRGMGAIPAFYIPMFAPPGSLEGVGASMLARLCEVSMVISRLRNIQTLAKGGDQNATVDLTRNGMIVAKSRATLGGASDLMKFLTEGIRPLDELEAALQWFPGLFYPVDSPTFPESLRYYHQREWKILGNIVKDGVPITRRLTQTEITLLLELNSGFFEKEIEFRSGPKRRVDECLLLDMFDGKPVFSTARRLIVPRSIVAEVVARTKAKGMSIDVAELESMARTT